MSNDIFPQYYVEFSRHHTSYARLLRMVVQQARDIYCWLELGPELLDCVRNAIGCRNSTQSRANMYSWYALLVER